MKQNLKKVTTPTTVYYMVSDASVFIGCSTSTVKQLVRDLKLDVARTVKRVHLLTESQLLLLKAEFGHRRLRRPLHGNRRLSGARHGSIHDDGQHSSVRHNHD